MKEAEMCSHYPPHTEELTEEVKSRNTAIMQAFHRIGKVNVASLMEIAPGEFYVLRIIDSYSREHPEEMGIYVSKIAKMAHIASSQVSRMLKSLEERRLIGRSVDARDRRNTYVFLTEEGKAISERTHRKMEQYTCRVVETMGENRVEELVRLCNRMADVMELELGKELERQKEPGPEKEPERQKEPGPENEPERQKEPGPEKEPERQKE